jgi:integrase
MRRTNLLLEFQAILRANDLPQMRLHDLRHTANTLLANWQVSREERRSLLGHSATSTLSETVYRHQTEDSHAAVRSAWSEILSPESAPEGQRGSIHRQRSKPSK